VDVFLVQKHIFVETSQPLKQLFANRESGAGDCGYIARHSILIGVTAHSSAHRNPAQMDVAAARVDQLGTIGEKNSRSRQSDPFGIKRSNQRVEPSFANGCVWIQEDEMLAASSLYRGVCAGCEAEVFPRDQELDGWKCRFDCRCVSLRRCVVE